MSEKTVLIITNTIESGLIDRSAADTACAVKAMGWNPIIISAGGRMTYELKRAGVEHYALPIGSADFFTARGIVKKITSIAKETGASIIHAFTPDAAYYGSKVAAALGLRLVSSYLTIYEPKLWSLKPNRTVYMNRADFTIAPSEFMAAYLQGAYKLANERIAIIPQWIDTEIFNINFVSAERIIRTANELRIPEDKFIITTLSRLQKTKGQPTLLAAVARLPAEKRKNLLCLIISAHKESKAVKKSLVKLAKNLGIDGIVLVTGGVSDIPAALMLSDVFVSTDVEPKASQPHILEAEALGRPVIASNIGAAAEYCFNKEAVRLYEPANDEALAAEILAVMKLTPAERAQIGNKSYSNVRLNFSKENLAPKVADIYEYVMRLTPQAGVKKGNVK